MEGEEEDIVGKKYEIHLACDGRMWFTIKVGRRRGEIRDGSRWRLAAFGER